jgi:hypothetical protein
VSLLLRIVAAYLAASVTVGLPLGVALGSIIRRADRRHRQHVAMLMRSRTLQDVRSAPSVPRPRPASAQTSGLRECSPPPGMPVGIRSYGCGAGAAGLHEQQGDQRHLGDLVSDAQRVVLALDQGEVRDDGRGR